MKAGKFDAEIVSVSVPGKKEATIVKTDEAPRADTTLEALAKLKPAFGKDAPKDMPPDQLTVTAGNCTGSGAPLVVQVQDQYGNLSPVTAAITVDLSASSGTSTATFTFASNQNCNGGGVTSFPIAAGGSATTNIFFKTTGAGSWTISASSPGLTQGDQVETVIPAAPMQLAYLSAAQTVARNACSALVTFQIQDTYGNPATSMSDTNVSLGPGGFYKNAACTTANGTNVVTILAGQTDGSTYFKAPATAGSYTITISGVGSPVNQVETIQ
jgi:hypothetical protein